LVEKDGAAKVVCLATGVGSTRVKENMVLVFASMSRVP